MIFREATLGAVAQYRLASNGENKTSAYRRAEHDLASVPPHPIEVRPADRSEDVVVTKMINGSREDLSGVKSESRYSWYFITQLSPLLKATLGYSQQPSSRKENPLGVGVRQGH
jgi:hypothetical protein